VHVIGLADGAFPSDMALRSRDGLAEEQRLFYVGVTRARDELSLHVPLRMPHHRTALDDKHSFAVASRFLADAAPHCETVERGPARASAPAAPVGVRVKPPVLDGLWS
jgi:DNA helicase-2/ATP-dependent DNA helicase PcrA